MFNILRADVADLNVSRARVSVKLSKIVSPFFFLKVQQGRTGNSEKEAALPSTKAEFTSPPSLFKTGLPPSRLVDTYDPNIGTLVLGLCCKTLLNMKSPSFLPVQTGTLYF